MISGSCALAPCGGECSPAPSHTWARAAARAVLIVANAAAGFAVVRSLNQRLMLGFEATAP